MFKLAEGPGKQFYQRDFIKVSSARKISIIIGVKEADIKSFEWHPRMGQQQSLSSPLRCDIMAGTFTGEILLINTAGNNPTNPGYTMPYRIEKRLINER